MEEGNAEITPVDKEVLSTWLANNHEEYAEFKELCHALATETDITKISKTFDVDIESLINLLTVFILNFRLICSDNASCKANYL